MALNFFLFYTVPAYHISKIFTSTNFEPFFSKLFTHFTYNNAVLPTLFEILYENGM